MCRPPLTAVPFQRRTEPSAWLCPPPGKRRMPDGGVVLHSTDVARRIDGQRAPVIVPLFPGTPRRSA